MAEPAARAHVSGVVVHARPAAAAAVAETIAAMDGAEVAARDGGKLVVVIEAADEHGLSETLNRISLAEDVYSAALVAHYVDDPEAMGEEA